MLDLDRAVKGSLLLSTVPGAVDYLVEELRHLPTVTIEGRRADAVRIAVDGPLRPLVHLPYYMSAAVLLPSSVESAVNVVTEAVKGGPMAALSGPIGFRVGSIGDARWPLRDALVEVGWQNDPRAWAINIEADVDGLRAEIGGLYWTKRFGELVRAPASTNPVIAAVMVRLAKPEPTSTVLDPFCGAGTLLVTALRRDAARIFGSDHDRRWVDAAAENVSRAQRLSSGGADVAVARNPVADTPGNARDVLLWRGDARAIPLADRSVDRVVANLPFGKRVGSHVGNQTLYPAVFAEIARLLPKKGRAVVLTEDKRLLVDTVQRTRGLRIIKDITFSTGGAHPSAYVVTTRGR